MSPTQKPSNQPARSGVAAFKWRRRPRPRDKNCSLRRVSGCCAGLPVTASPHSFRFFGGAAFVIRALASLGASFLRPGWESFDKHLIFSPGLAARRFRAAFFIRLVELGPKVKAK
jgi:hypothetical protein